MPFDAFLKLGDITGDSTDAAHKGEIVVQAYSFGVSNTASLGSATGGAGAGKAVFSDLNFTTAMSSASPKLLLACASGKHFPDAVLTLRKAGGSKGALEFCKVTLKEVLISSFQDAGASAENLPTDSATLTFGAIKFEYFTQDPSGKTVPAASGGWSQKENKQFT
ncbi:MAG: type VI secretion system tube protein Hcp [Actinomycetota bacterium]